MGYADSGMAKNLANDVYSLIEYDYPGLLGVETATAYWGMSTFNIGIPIFLVNDDNTDAEGYFARCALSALFAPKVNSHNIVRLSEKLFITDREQTVIDMIRYKRHEFHLYETVLSAYEDGEADIERLEKLALEYNVLDRLHEIYKEASQ